MSLPSEIHEDMKVAGEHLRGAIAELETVSAQAVGAGHEAELAWDQAFIEAEGSEQHRKSIANIATQELRLQADGLKAREKTVKQSINAWRSILSSLQSAAAALREEMRFDRTGPNF